ncbi:hypothetical protein RRG08_055858 [Elysia crispata]|uniref:Uncharacterized protein n=1 Tax=Elysia crispata TaxID=231223 RepID=A0AAE1DJ59_9GAST|nr:hypothetical protein RRG08_055858 [Elysia crispata]
MAKSKKARKGGLKLFASGRSTAWLTTTGAAKCCFQFLLEGYIKVLISNEEEDFPKKKSYYLQVYKNLEMAGRFLRALCRPQNYY